MRVGVIADDVTGSNDIGSMFVKNSYRVFVLSLDPRSGDFPDYVPGDADVIILNTNSRLDAPEVAYRKVFAAAGNLQAHGCRQFYKKTCSAFRGNIGVEMDAMLDALAAQFAVMVVGFPKNGRTTVDGIHYVHGKRLEESQFRYDPIHPMRQSDLVAILQAQTQRKVGRVGHAVIAQGADALRSALDGLRETHGYAILDVTDQEALRTIAQAVRAEPLLAGSSALGEELPPVWGLSTLPERPLQLPKRAGVGLLVVCGSLMPQSAAQIEVLRGQGAPVWMLNTTLLFDSAQAEVHLQALADAVTQSMMLEQDVVLHTPQDAQVIEQTRRLGQAQGLDGTQAARVVSRAVAECTARILRQTGQNRMVVAGGETSDAICERLGVSGMQVWREIAPGLPSCLTLTDPAYLLVLKSGSFGRAEFFAQALEHLRAA